jgi:hypothetical protein
VPPCVLKEKRGWDENHSLVCGHLGELPQCVRIDELLALKSGLVTISVRCRKPGDVMIAATMDGELLAITNSAFCKPSCRSHQQPACLVSGDRLGQQSVGYLPVFC